MIYLFLADGFEEVEALSPLDLLRRAGHAVMTVSITENDIVTGSHGIRVIADTSFEKCRFDDAEMLILPGGMPGTRHLAEHKPLGELLLKSSDAGCYLAAICAAPSVFGGLGILRGKKATCYPGFEDRLSGASFTEQAVVQDGRIITSRGMGTALPFGLKLVEVLSGAQKADELRRAVIG